MRLFAVITLSMHFFAVAAFAEDKPDFESLIEVNRPLFAGDPEVRILGYGKEQMWKQIFT
ncbi:MAG: hypothetical protein AB8B58_19970 [Roseobacter sp.]